MQIKSNSLSACILVAAVIASAAAATQPGSTLIMKNQSLRDDGLGMDAYSVLVPQGWCESPRPWAPGRINTHWAPHRMRNV